MEYIILRDRVFFVGKIADIIALLREKKTLYKTLREMIEGESR